MENTKLPGKSLILVSSILFIIGSGINIIVSIPMLLTADYWDRTLPIFMPWSIWYIFAIVVSLFTIFIAIRGIKFCNVAEKASGLFTLGIISLIIAAIVIVFNLTTLGFTPLAFAGVLWPVLYTIGASKNKRMM